MIPTVAEATARLEAILAARDGLLNFTKLTYPGWINGEHQKLICDRLESVERGEIDRLIITAPPRHGKSELATIRFPAWFLGRSPDKQIIQVSSSEELVRKFGRRIRDLIGSPEYGHIFPTRIASDSRSQGRWETVQGGEFFAAGLGSTIVGRGADLASIDDYFRSAEEAFSANARDKIWDWYTEVLCTRLMWGGRAAITIVATRWHEDDLIGRCLQQDHENWELLELKAITGEGDDRKALWPQAWPLDVLDRKHKGMPADRWESLYQQDPQPETGTYFQREWFKRYDTAPDVTVYITTDFAVTDNDGDFTEFGVWGVDGEDNLYALDWWFGQETMDVWIDSLLNLVQKWKPMTVWGERGVIKNAVQPFLNKRCNERRVYCHFDWITRTADKVAMARTFQGRCSMGKVYFPKEDWANRVINQCIGFPAGKHDDAVDVCALIGLALDHTVARSVPQPKKEKKRDRYDRAFRRAEDSQYNWKLA